MMRFFFILLITMVGLYLFLSGRLNDRIAEKPAFLQFDQVAAAHQTTIKIINHAPYSPTNYQLEILKKDYSAIWAHLNQLFQTNDVAVGKEYYTEDWFKQLVVQYDGPINNAVQRTDLQHELHIQNWATDALVCTAIDSNLVFRYVYPNNKTRLSKAHLAIVLLYQGDHWRVDAIKVLGEQPLN